MSTNKSPFIQGIFLTIGPDELVDVIRSNLAEIIDSRFVSNDKMYKEPVHIDDLLTAGAAADLLDVSRQTLNKWERGGLLTPVRLGRRVYYRRSDIDEALSARQ